MLEILLVLPFHLQELTLSLIIFFQSIQIQGTECIYCSTVLGFLEWFAGGMGGEFPT
jgi:hypothetical protein